MAEKPKNQDLANWAAHGVTALRAFEHAFEVFDSLVKCENDLAVLEADKEELSGEIVSLRKTRDKLTQEVKEKAKLTSDLAQLRDEHAKLMGMVRGQMAALEDVEEKLKTVRAALAQAKTENRQVLNELKAEEEAWRLKTDAAKGEYKTMVDGLQAGLPS